MADIQLEFHNTTLTGDEANRAEKLGMLLLASDYIGSGKVDKAKKLTRISKGNLTFILSRTKSGDYLAINPFSNSQLQIPLTQLPSRSSIIEYIEKHDDLNLDKLRDKLMSFETEQAVIEGGFNKNQIQTIEELLQAPRADRKDFKKIQPTRDISQIKADIKQINDLVYDEKSLDKEINERLDIVEKSLKENAQEVEQRYKERQDYWNKEIENKNELLQKRLKEREKQLEQDKEKLEKDTDKQISKNLKKFKDGVAKNIRKDEKPIEKSIQNLEKLVSKDANRELVDQIENELVKLSDFVQIFSEAVGFAKQQVGIVKEKEQDILEMKDLEMNRLEKKAEKDKEELREQSKQKEKERDRELSDLKEERDKVVKKLQKFKDIRSDWVNEIKSEIGNQDTAMINKRFIPDNGNSKPKTVELLIPLYIFQYEKDNEHFTIAIPPVKMPDNMKKVPRNSLHGDHKTVYYNLVVENTEDLITDWLLKAAKSLELHSNIQQLDNLLNDPAELRDSFFSSRGLMVDKLKVNRGDFNKANDRLTEVFTEG